MSRQKTDDAFIVLFFMRKCTTGTVFDTPAALFDIRMIARTVFIRIEGTITEQAIDMFHLMAGIIPAIAVLKILMIVFVRFIHADSIP